MNWASIFGVIVAGTLLMSWASRDHVLQKVSLLLMCAWAASNFVVQYFGFQSAPLIVPSIDAVIAVLIAATGYRSRSSTALAVFLLYAVVGVVHVGAFILRMQATYTYYTVLGVLFLAQLLTVDGAGAWLVFRAWSTGRGERLGADPARWHGLAR